MRWKLAKSNWKKTQRARPQPVNDAAHGYKVHLGEPRMPGTEEHWWMALNIQGLQESYGARRLQAIVTRVPIVIVSYRDDLGTSLKLEKYPWTKIAKDCIEHGVPVDIARVEPSMLLIS